MVVVWCYAGRIIGILIPFYSFRIQCLGSVSNDIIGSKIRACTWGGGGRMNVWNLAIEVEGDVVFGGGEGVSYTDDFFSSLLN
jgi:hypothetical protein